MYLAQRYPLVSAYVITLVFYAYTFLSGLEFIDRESFVVWFPMVSIGYLILLLLVWASWALIGIPVRHFCLKRKTSLRRSLAFTLQIGLLLGFTMLAWQTWLTTRSEHVQRAKNFVDVAVPALEHYHDLHRHYPNSLSELKLPISVPWGLVYRMSSDASMNEWPSGGRDKESYSIFFGDLWYRGDEKWEFGGL